MPMRGPNSRLEEDMGYTLNFDAVWRSSNALIEGLFLGLGLAMAAGIAEARLACSLPSC